MKPYKMLTTYIDNEKKTLTSSVLIGMNFLPKSFKLRVINGNFSRWGPTVGKIETRASNKAQGQRCDLKVDKIEIVLEANVQIARY